MHCSAVVYARQSSTTTGSVLVANDNGLLHGRRAACFKRTPGICRRRFLQRHTVHRYVSACLTAFVSLFAGQLSLLTSAGWKMITRQSVAKLCGYGQKQVRLIPTVD